jgi:23S rRNA (cytosine1962-C5)-methyltransferase
MNSSPLYSLLDSGHGRKLERVGGILINRPEPQALWAPALPNAEWQKAQATFAPKASDEDGDGGNWQVPQGLPERWKVDWNGLPFYARLTPFRHLGFFAEQAPQWDWLAATTQPGMQVLNLFGYTGVASLVAARAGAHVAHIDASKKALGYARENAELAGLTDASIRWLPDEAVAFCHREVRRGKAYDIILLDPPKFGRGPNGEVWDFMRDMPPLLEALGKIVKPNGHVWLTAYALRVSGAALASMLQSYLPAGTTTPGEFTVQDAAGRAFGVSMWARWQGNPK